MKFIDLQQHIKDGRLKSSYLITGDDAFVVKSAVDKFRVLAGSLPELNYTVYEKDFSVEDVLATLYTPPMLSDYRIVRINDYADEREELTKYINSPNPSTVLLFVGELTSAFKKLTGMVEVVDCNKLDKAFIVNWIRMKARSERASIDEAAAEMLAEYCNRDMSKVVAELQKLMSYSCGEPITQATVKLLVQPELEYKVFELSEAIAERSAEKAMPVLETLLGGGVAPIMLLGMLYSHFRRMLYVSLNPQSDTLAGELGVKEYAVKVAARQAKKYSPRRLKAICERLYAFDAGIKSGAVTDKNALTVFVCDTLLRG